MLTPFVLPDNGIPVKIGDRSFIYQDVFHPIEWYDGKPYRTRVETLVIGNMGTTIFLRIDEENHKYRIPGGSVDDDSSYEKQAENETNEEALLAVKDLVFSGITYQEKMDKDFLKKGHDFPIAYVGAFNYVYIAIASGKVDKSTIEEKDLDDDMATNGKFYPINEVAGILHRYHLEALCNSDKVNPTMKILLQKNLSERMVDNVNKPIFEGDNTFLVEDDDLSYIYHGSTYDIDVFHPMALDLGNGKEKPGWSTFCFRNPVYARNFALMRLIQKNCGDKPETKCGWDLKERRPYVHNKVLNEVRKSVIGEKFYVYKIDAENLELGLGNDVRFAEVTFREDNVKPVDRETYYVDINLLNDIVKVIDVEPKKYEKSQMNTKNFDRGWLTCMINRDYSGDSAVAKLTKAVSDGKLKPGDDVEAYTTDNGIDMEDIDLIRRMGELSESFDISGDYEETLLLGDNKVIFTSSSMDLYSEDRIDEETYFLPKSKTFPDDAKIQYKRYMYHIDDKGNPFLMAMSDFISFENDKEVFGCMRIFVRPVYRKNKLGTILVGDMMRYLSNITPMKIAVEIHNDIANKEWFRKWAEGYGFSELGKPSNYSTGFSLQLGGHKDIFEKGYFSEYGKYADLNGARGEITTEACGNTNGIVLEDLTSFEVPVLMEGTEENNSLEPIFIVLSFTGTPFGKLITKYQRCKFSHAALSLDSKLDNLYTFNMRMDKKEIEKDGKTIVKSKPAGGANIEHLKDYRDVSTGGDADICVMCIFVTREVKRAVKQAIDKIFADIDKTRYALSNVLNIVVNRAIDTTDSLKMICSQFVDNVLKMANIDITHKSSNLVSPNDFAKLPSTNSHVFVLFEGKKDQYSSRVVDNKVRYIKNSDQYGDLDIAKSNSTGLVAEEDDVEFKTRRMMMDIYKRNPQKVFEAEGDDELPDVGKENEASDYTEDAQKSVEDNADDEGEDNAENDAEGGTPEDVENDLEDPNYDDAGGAEGTDDTQTDTTDTGEENENQTNNNTIKNYSILRDFDGLFRLANDMSKTLEHIIMEKPIQNKVLTQVKENLSAIKNGMKDFIVLHYKPNNYAFNLYYYELFANLINKNLQILEKNKLFSTEYAKRSMNSNKKTKIKEVN